MNTTFPQRSHKEIVVTLHAKQRAEERLKLTHIAEIRKVAASAKNKGISLRCITVDNCEGYGISKDLLKEIRQSFFYNSNSNKMYYYKGNVFVFVGKNSCTLKTVVNIKQQFEATNKLREVEL